VAASLAPQHGLAHSRQDASCPSGRLTRGARAPQAPRSCSAADDQGRLREIDPTLSEPWPAARGGLVPSCESAELTQPAAALRRAFSRWRSGTNVYSPGRRTRGVGASVRGRKGRLAARASRGSARGRARPERDGHDALSLVGGVHLCVSEDDQLGGPLVRHKPEHHAALDGLYELLSGTSITCVVVIRSPHGRGMVVTGASRSRSSDQWCTERAAGTSRDPLAVR
jgi:hypothetical protein